MNLKCGLGVTYVAFSLFGGFTQSLQVYGYFGRYDQNGKPQETL